MGQVFTGSSTGPKGTINDNRRSMKKRSRVWVVLIHVVIWSIFLSLPALFNPRRQGWDIGGFVHDLLLPTRLTIAILLIIVFYFSYYVAIPKWYIGRKYGWLILTFLVSLSLMFFAENALHKRNMHMDPNRGGMFPGPQGREAMQQGNPQMNPGSPMNPGMPPGFGMGNRPPAPKGFFRFGASYHFFMFLLVYAGAFALYIYDQWQRAREEKLNAEIAFLKAQINPHFLFNTLNSIYSLALTGSDKTADAVLKLSGMMRYSVHEAHRDEVSLEDEINYLNNYVQLQTLRLTPNVQVHYEVTGQTIGKMIEPFLLLPFVENAFKYGVSPEEDAKIDIVISVTGNELVLRASNLKVRLREGQNTGLGLGISTTKRRLELSYPGKHDLDIQENQKEFKITLKIQLV
jgi:hypothetical protein